MSLAHEWWSAHRRAAPAILGLALVVAVLGAAKGGPPGDSAAPPQPAWTQAPDEPVVLDTPANLQAAFGDGVNSSERFRAYAVQADAEGRTAAARLFRACATSDSVLARRFVQAIAWTGQSARAQMERVPVASTAENLRSEIDRGRYAVETWYPALLARAREDRQSMAVRSFTLALGTGRGQLELLSEALERLDLDPAAATFRVCPYCGRMVETLDFEKCPGCYTAAARFLRPA